jgi:arylsulfatase A-like enzyme
MMCPKAKDSKARVGLSILGVAMPNTPNVVIMLADNIGYGDIGAYGAGEVRGMPTPHLDQLAGEGLRLTQFLCEPGCTPSRAALLLGRYSPRAGLGSIIIGGTPNTLQAKEVTLAQLFKSKGYDTAITGKWHLGSEEQSLPINHGFDEYAVGVIETTDGTMYRESMQRSGVPDDVIAKGVPYIYESDPATHKLKRVREYTLDYRRQIEGDIAKYSVDYIKREAAAKKPFFLYIGWTHTHYPSLVAPEFEGKSRIGPYGDAMMELDARTGQVLDAIKQAGIEDNTIVIWVADNSATPMQGPPEFRGGSNGPFRGEVGDALDGSIRVPGMIRWPGHIKPGVSNEMVSMHDFFPTIANIIGAPVPTDRPIDGVDQSDFFLGRQAKSNREGLITFIGDEIVAVRWRQWRIYPKQFVSSAGNPSMGGGSGYRMEGAGYPSIFNVEADPREENCVTAFNAWVINYYSQIIGAYLKSLDKYPNPPAISLTTFKTSRQ